MPVKEFTIQDLDATFHNGPNIKAQIFQGGPIHDGFLFAPQMEAFYKSAGSFLTGVYICTAREVNYLVESIEEGNSMRQVFECGPMGQLEHDAIFESSVLNSFDRLQTLTGKKVRGIATVYDQHVVGANAAMLIESESGQKTEEKPVRYHDGKQGLYTLIFNNIANQLDAEDTAVVRMFDDADVHHNEFQGAVSEFLECHPEFKERFMFLSYLYKFDCIQKSERAEYYNDKFITQVSPASVECSVSMQTIINEVMRQVPTDLRIGASAQVGMPAEAAAAPAPLVNPVDTRATLFQSSGVERNYANFDPTVLFGISDQATLDDILVGIPDLSAYVKSSRGPAFDRTVLATIQIYLNESQQGHLTLNDSVTPSYKVGM